MTSPTEATGEGSTQHESLPSEPLTQSPQEPSLTPEDKTWELGESSEAESAEAKSAEAKSAEAVEGAPTALEPDEVVDASEVPVASDVVVTELQTPPDMETAEVENAALVLEEDPLENPSAVDPVELDSADATEGARTALEPDEVVGASKVPVGSAVVVTELQTPPDIETVEVEDASLVLQEDPLENPPAADPVDLVEELNSREKSTARTLLQAELTVKAKRDRYEDLARQVDDARENRDALIRARDSLDAWLNERKRSLSIHLIQHVDSELARAAADESRIRNFGRVRDFSGFARELRRAFVINMWAALGTAAIVTLVLFIIALVLRQFALTMPILELSPWRYAVLFAVLLLLGTLRALLPYHRGYVKMRRELDQQLAWGRHAMSSIERIRQDQSRLAELRPQLEERLEFYGCVLQESWRIPTTQDIAASEQALAESLPANLQVATVTETTEGTWNRLLQRFTAQQFKTGLRREAADRLLAEASTLHGLDASRVDFAFLDKDNLQRDLRLVLMQYAQDPEVLERLGRERTIQIAEAIQRALSPHDDNRPEISLANLGDLDGLRVGNDLLADWRSVRNSWDDFMSEILEDPSALSPLAFSGRGQADGQHHRFDSVAVAPERVRVKASKRVTWADIRSDVVTGTEMATRIDITEPIDVNRVALFVEPIDEEVIPADHVHATL